MKIIFLTFAIVCLLFHLQCTSKNYDVRSKTESLNDRLQLHKHTQDNSLAKMDEIDISESTKETEYVLKKISKDFSLQNLKEKKLSDDEVEIRIWAELRYEIVNCFILHKKNNNWKASLISAQVTDDGEFERTKQGKIIVNRQTLSPKSGWENVSNYLTQKVIRFPLPYSLDTREIPPIPDEGMIDLEIKEGGNYNLVFFREFTTSEDGQTIINVCKNLEKEFNVAIGCGN